MPLASLNHRDVQLIQFYGQQTSLTLSSLRTLDIWQQYAVDLAKSSDIVVLAVGAAWNSDGESGDRATLGLPSNQSVLADAIFALGKPVVLVLQGGRPFAIPQYYNKAAAVLNTFFPGQSGGQAIADAEKVIIRGPSVSRHQPASST